MAPPGLLLARKRTLALASALTALAYYVVASEAVGARTVTPSISPLWPSSGLGLAAALTWGCATACPAVFVASLGIGVLEHLPWLATLAMAAANALEVFAAGEALSASKLNGHSFYNPRDFAVYSLITGASTAAASACVVAVFGAERVLGGASFGFAFLTRVLAHWTGMLTVAPLLLLWRHHPRLSKRPAATAEGLAMAAAALAVCWLLFSGAGSISREHAPLSFLLFPLALWPAVRQGLRETATVLMFIAGAALWGTVNGCGPFGGLPYDSAVTVLQGFLAVEAIVCMSLASAVWSSKDYGRELEAARARLRLVLDSSQGYIAYIDREWRFRLANQMFTRWFHQTTESLLGRTVRELAGAGYDTVEPLLTRAFTGQPVRATVVQPDPGGAEHWMDMSFAPDFDAAGEVRGLIMLALDVTADKTNERALSRAQKELKRLNAELEKRVEQRTARLKQVNDELESFAYTVAHDLRSPLRKMSGFSEAVLRDYGGKLDAKGDEYLHRIFEASKRMGRLIDEVLDLSLVTRSEVRDELVDLSGFARGFLDELRRDEPGRAVTCVVADGLSARGDPGLLETALRNLLDNAWKFTRPKPRARIEFGMIPQEPVPIFYVRDNGVGFDMAQKARLFGAFERLHAREEFPGSGIGLATVQRVVQRHGGRVWAEAEPGKGAAFYFTLHERSGG